MINVMSVLINVRNVTNTNVKTANLNISCK